MADSTTTAEAPNLSRMSAADRVDAFVEALRNVHHLAQTNPAAKIAFRGAVYEALTNRQQDLFG